MEEKFYDHVLFPLIRTGLGLTAEPPSETIDYDRLREVGQKQAILPILRNALQQLNIMDDDGEQIRSLCYADLFQFAARDHALQEVTACFDRSRIAYVLLKGSVLRELYPEKWMRTSCDIDVLVHEEDLEQAAAALEKETQFCRGKQWQHDLSMRMQDVHLELHFSIKEDMENIDRLLSCVWEYAQKKENSFEYVLTPEYQIFHVVAHLCYHFTHSGMGIRPYFDLWLLRHKTEYNENTVREMCDRCGILKFYEACCDLSEAWLAGKTHTDVTRAMERYCLGGGVYGSKENRVLTDMRKNPGAKYVMKRLFVSRELLEHMYPTLKRHPALLPYYHAKRWSRVFTGRRKRMIRELEIRKNADAEQIKTLDELMKGLGL